MQSRRICVLPLVLAACISCASCAPTSTDDDQTALESAALDQGIPSASLFQSRSLVYCFLRPRLEEMPPAVRAEIPTQAALESLWLTRARQFTSAVDRTWQAQNLVQLAPAIDVCNRGDVPIHFASPYVETALAGRGGYATTLGPGAGIELNAELFLTKSFDDRYYTFAAVHEMGHVLGFRHEQDRPDATCQDSPNRSGFGILLTPYDPNSIMNYCDSGDATLTSLDLEGFASAYSFVKRLTNTCGDDNAECGAWAASGECQKNASYMSTHCCASCKSSAPCRDQNPSCASWAANDQCTANPSYMHYSCCASCSGGGNVFVP